MDYLQKPITCSKYFVHLSEVNLHVSEHVSAIRMTSPCVIVYRQDSQDAQSCCQYISVLCKYVLMETMAKVVMTIIENAQGCTFSV